MPLGTIHLLACSVLVSATVLAQGPDDEVRCNYQSRDVCTKDRCIPAPNSETVSGNYILVPSLSKLTSAAQLPGGGEVEIRLCDPHGCTPVAMHVAGFGAFMHLTQANGGAQFMKLYVWSQPEPLYGERQGDFIEGESLFLTAVVGFGHWQFPKL